LKLIKPYYKILKYPKIEDLWIIEDAGRVCYKSEDKITKDSYRTFFENLLKRNHEAVLEHSQITVKFICDRGISHELVRHRLASFCQESTRYCNYSKDKFDNQVTFIIPSWVKLSVDDLNNGHISPKDNYDVLIWVKEIEQIEKRYFQLIEDFKWTPGQARSILPNSVKTEVVMTANIREWRHVLKLRTSKKAHEQMRELMIPLLEELQTKVPVLFDDINKEVDE
jgi:thymidylate synthase (FAD)